ncbi:hypothetical protein NG726_15045 [Pseudomonas sp. MOB-449]|nr:hypothetical protein [Pseudomonas sp. MOB-449]
MSLPFIHSPIRPARTDVFEVMMERWQALMNHYESRWLLDHGEAMEKQRVALLRSTEFESRIDLAISGGGEHATAATARDAVAYAGGDLPDDRKTDFLKSRSTRLITTALLVARDDDDALLAAEETWVRQVVAIALEQHSIAAADQRIRCASIGRRLPSLL